MNNYEPTMNQDNFKAAEESISGCGTAAGIAAEMGSVLIGQTEVVACC